MKRILLLSLTILVSFLAQAQQVVTTTNLNVRDEPSASGDVLTVIPRGTIISLEDCSNNWCQTNYSGYTGYVSSRYVSTETDRQEHYRSVHSTGAVKHYTNSKGNRVQSPTHYNAAPEGATAQCRDGSYSFSQSRRGTCSHHGGVKRWLR